jgi:hypothetical protein
MHGKRDIDALIDGLSMTLEPAVNNNVIVKAKAK